MQQIAPSELILNERGAIYHLDLRPEELAETVLTVGDPDRVPLVTRYFDQIEIKRQHREFVSNTGFIGKKRLSVVSTGIGPDNIDIVLNELDALCNIDFSERKQKAELKSLNIIRVGTSGSLQADVPVDSFVVSTHGLGLDNLIHFYRFEQNDQENQLIQSFITQTQLTAPMLPYVSMGSVNLIKKFVGNYHHGITVTCPGFYGPQGRILRLGTHYPLLIDHLTDFSFGPHRITNFEMETSAIYGLGKLLGHHCVSISAIVANRITKKFSIKSEATMKTMIQEVLQKITESD